MKTEEKNILLNIFMDEFRLIYTKLASKLNIRSFDAVPFDIVLVDHANVNSLQIAISTFKSDSSYELVFIPDGLENSWNEIKDKKIYSDKINLLKSTACHEAVIVAIHELTFGKSTELDDKLFRQLYEPLKAKYTNYKIKTK